MDTTIATIKIKSCIGRGGFASVFETNHCDMVLKICNDPDDPYFYYLDAFEGTSKHAPIVFDQDGESVLIERLEELDPYEHAALFAEIRDVKGLLLVATYDDVSEMLENAFSTLHYEPSFIEYLRDVIYAGFEQIYTLDLHSENIMKRSDGTLVITDPWC